MKDAAFSDGIFFSIVERHSRAPHSDRQNTDLLLHYLLSYLQRYFSVNFYFHFCSFPGGELL